VAPGATIVSDAGDRTTTEGSFVSPPPNPPLQRTDAPVAPLPRASAPERQYRWAASDGLMANELFG
jgi:hypothetical protein